MAVKCKCGREFEDHETWYTHAKEGMPKPVVRKRPDFQAQQKELKELLDYAKAHKVEDSFKRIEAILQKGAETI